MAGFPDDVASVPGASSGSRISGASLRPGGRSPLSKREIIREIGVFRLAAASAGANNAGMSTLVEAATPAVAAARGGSGDGGLRFEGRLHARRWRQQGVLNHRRRPQLLLLVEDDDNPMLLHKLCNAEEYLDTVLHTLLGMASAARRRRCCGVRSAWQCRTGRSQATR